MSDNTDKTTTTLKITNEELSEFNVLKEEIQKNIFDLGELYLEKMEFDDLLKSLIKKENELREKSESFKQRESNLMSKILQKYGEGSLNISSGIFTASQKTTQ